MKHEKGFLHKAADVVVGAVAVLWILKWCFTTRLGMFLWLTLIGGLAAALALGGTVNFISWHYFNDYSTDMVDSGWFWAISFLGSAIWTLDYMYRRELLIRAKPLKAPDED